MLKSLPACEDLLFLLCSGACFPHLKSFHRFVVNPTCFKPEIRHLPEVMGPLLRVLKSTKVPDLSVEDIDMMSHRFTCSSFHEMDSPHSTRKILFWLIKQNFFKKSTFKFITDFSHYTPSQLMSIKCMTSTVGEEVGYTLLLLLLFLDYKRVFALEIFGKQFQVWKG